MSRSILLLLILAASAKASLASSSSVETNVVQHTNSRWLTYACGSKEDGDRERHLLRRMLTHPCGSRSRTSTANDVYNDNSTRGSNTVLNVLLGLVAGVSLLLGLLFLTDRDTFAQVTGVAELPCSCTCAKPRIDEDEDQVSEPTPFEQDIYHLTEETQEYLAAKKDTEEKLMRQCRSLFRCWPRTKEHGASDKYKIPATSSEAEEGVVHRFWALWEDVRLRVFWRPSKKYNQKDKYDVNVTEVRSDGGTGATGEDDIKYAASSYESAEPGTTPW